MPWYVVQQFSSISGINYVNEQRQFKNEPIIVVLNPQGKVENRNPQGWVVLCKGTRLVFSGYGPTVLKVMKQFDDWKQQVKTDSEFLKVFEKCYDEELAKNKNICLDFDMPKNVGLIEDGMKCPDCSKTMEMYFRFK